MIFNWATEVPETWNNQIEAIPNAHFLQTSEWARVKAAYGWMPITCTWSSETKLEAACLVLERELSLGRLATGVRILYAPRGPLMDACLEITQRRKILIDLMELARHRQAIMIKIDPEVLLGFGEPGESGEEISAEGEAWQESLTNLGWRYSQDQIQFSNTVWVDLNPNEDELLNRMKQKTRYNVRLATKKGISIRIATEGDFSLLYRMYVTTAQRDGFVIREEAYYHAVWKSFIDAEKASALVAEINDIAIAGLILFHFAKRGWYFYGMSSDEHRDKMPNHLLQWEAMRRAKSLGCQVYDLWGAPDRMEATDPLWGVYRFKRGLGGRLIRTTGAWDFAVKPIQYRLYTQLLPRFLARLLKKAQPQISPS